MIDHLGFREYSTYTADLDGLCGAERVWPDIARCKAKVTSGLLQECTSASRALVVEAERTHTPAFANADGLDVLTADIENRAHFRK